ncbi:hypothetical protein H4R34_000825 [Dimargaris verticillata]|uniref:Uncharacterized protein n=1 Tax=Dimargaris verticillata TaxID=2761393 RepID=A0A9W8B4P0_9FUNG|nr:hypothetical protein H4R34_000825 [Dimargaris verticillata]
MAHSSSHPSAGTNGNSFRQQRSPSATHSASPPYPPTTNTRKHRRDESGADGAQPIWAQRNSTRWESRRGHIAPTSPPPAQPSKWADTPGERGPKRSRLDDRPNRERTSGRDGGATNKTQAGRERPAALSSDMHKSLNPGPASGRHGGDEEEEEGEITDESPKEGEAHAIKHQRAPSPAPFASAPSPQPPAQPLTAAPASQPCPSAKRTGTILSATTEEGEWEEGEEGEIFAEPATNGQRALSATGKAQQPALPRANPLPLDAKTAIEPATEPLSPPRSGPQPTELSEQVVQSGTVEPLSATAPATGVPLPVPSSPPPASAPSTTIEPAIAAQTSGPEKPRAKAKAVMEMAPGVPSSTPTTAQPLNPHPQLPSTLAPAPPVAVAGSTHTVASHSPPAPVTTSADIPTQPGESSLPTASVESTGPNTKQEVPPAASPSSAPSIPDAIKNQPSPPPSQALGTCTAMISSPLPLPPSNHPAKAVPEPSSKPMPLTRPVLPEASFPPCLGYFTYQPGTLLPCFTGHEGSQFYVRIPRACVSPNNPRVSSQRAVWGSGVYTDDSDLVAMILHHGLPTATVGFPGQHDLLVTIRVVEPPATYYRGSTSQQGLQSRSWPYPHDGASWQIANIAVLPLARQPSIARGRKLLKQRLREYAIVRCRTLADKPLQQPGYRFDYLQTKARLRQCRSPLSVANVNRMSNVR